MLISHKWLEKYLPELNKYSSEEIAETLSKSLAEVEEIKQIRTELKNIVAGEVLRVEKHPNSDKLSLCEVTTDGSNRLQIVCGAPNVIPNIKVAVCLPNGRVYADTKNSTMDIQIAKIRDIESHGMLCSARELGIGNDHSGIMILDESVQVGKDLVEVLQDTVYEVENKSLSHRGDCFSHKGIARELAAVFSIELLQDEPNAQALIPSGEGKKLDISLNVDSKLCRRFSALLIENIDVKPSPLWLQAQLTAVGERPINNVVDITNYVMLDIGQPLHAYDYDKLEGKKLVIRTAKEGEKVITLDEIEHTLNKDMVVVADESGIEDIAGIMGGSKSSISENTRNIIVEAANWEMFNIRKTSRTLGIRTEASTRFEKGQDPNLTTDALQNSYIFITDMANGELATEMFDHYPEEFREREIELDINLVNRLLTLNLTRHEITELLERLRIYSDSKETSDGSDPNQEVLGTLLLTIPTFRPDLNIPEDLVEEVARIYGFDKLPPKLPLKTIRPPKKYKYSELFRLVTRRLVSLGMDEVKSYSFVGEQDFEMSKLNFKEGLKLQNPIAPELNTFRISIIPSLLKVARENQQNYPDVSVFEISRVVQKEKDGSGIHIQPWQLGFIDGRYKIEEAFANVRAMISNLEQLLGLELNYSIGKENSGIISRLFHPYKHGVIRLEEETIGEFGILHPEVANNYELKNVYSVAEINLDKLVSFVPKKPSYKKLNAYPKSSRDISFWISPDIIYSDIVSNIKKHEILELSGIDLVGTYQEEGKNSITLRFTFQGENSTLTDGDVDKLIEKVTAALFKKSGITLRE